MKKIIKRIKELFSKKPNREWVALNNATETGFLKYSPEATRKMIEEAYPDGAKFLSNLSSIPESKNSFLLEGGFAATSFISAHEGHPSPFVVVTSDGLKDLMNFMEKYPVYELHFKSPVLLKPVHSIYTESFNSSKGINQ